MASAPSSGVPGGSYRGGLLRLSRFFHDGGKIHLKFDLVTRGRLVGVFLVGPVGVHTATCDSVGALVLLVLSVLFLVKGLKNRRPHPRTGVGKINEV